MFSKQAGLTIAPSFSSPFGFPPGITRAAGQASWMRMFLAVRDPVPQGRAPQQPTDPQLEGTRRMSAASPPRSNATSWGPGTEPTAGTDGLAQAADPSQRVLFCSRTFTFKYQLRLTHGLEAQNEGKTRKRPIPTSTAPHPLEGLE